MTRRGLVIDKGKRHCKILDREGDVVFRTTNLRDAEEYLALVEENERLHYLLESRGVAPHRIYLLAVDEERRGRANLEKAPVKEVVIVAKADDGGVVVRHLGQGTEEIVDLEELEPIEGGAYLQATEVQDVVVNVVVRYDREAENAAIAAFHEPDNASDLTGHWTKAEEVPGSEYFATLAHSEGDILVFRAEASLDD